VCAAIGSDAAYCLIRVAPGRTARAAGSDGVTGLPADVTAILSLAGVWQPVDDQNVNKKLRWHSCQHVHRDFDHRF